MGACQSAKKNPDGEAEQAEGGSQGLVGPTSNQPLLSKIGKVNLPGGKLKTYELSFDATEEQQAQADIVLSWPIVQASDSQADEVATDPMEIVRHDLLQRLAAAGLDFTSMKSADEDEVFIIIQANEERLMEAAEVFGLDVKLCHSWEVPYAAFTIDRKEDFRWEDKAKGRLFSTRDRHTLIMHILEDGDFDNVDELSVPFQARRAWLDKYGAEKFPCCGLNLDMYVKQGVLNGYWAMHGHGRRFTLLNEWAYKVFSPQPLQMIFEYFNSKTAVYFAFIGYYTYWLVLASIFGLVVMFYDTFKASIGPIVGETKAAAAKAGGKATTPSDDNTLTMIFSFYMALWGTLFLEYWKRYSAEISYRWSTLNLDKEGHERHEYRKGCGDEKMAGFYTKNGIFVPYKDELVPPRGWCECITDRCVPYWPLESQEAFDAQHEEDINEKTKEKLKSLDPDEVHHMSESTRSKRVCINCGVAFFFTANVLVALIAFLVMRLVFQKIIDATYGGIIASSLQAAVTVGLNLVYCKIAVCMVEYENYRTDIEYENAITYKVFGFQFINSYFCLFYVAFLKGRIGPLMGYSDVCKDPSGKPADNCMSELSTLLLSTLLTVQIMSTIAEALVPYLTYKGLVWAEQKKWNDSGKEGPLQLSDIDHESKLTPCDPLDAFTDYNKMALQFGYVSMFCAAFPLAPVCALANNLLEIRTDAMKRLLGMQRPAPSERAETIGGWMTILELMSLAAVATNIGVLCFTSDHLVDTFKLTQSQRVWCFIILEHAVICIKLFMMGTIDDVPQWVSLRAARDSFKLERREEIIWREQEALKDEQEKLLSIGGVKLMAGSGGPSSGVDLSKD